MTQQIQTSKFNNNASQVMFIGNHSLADIIAQDTRELAEIGGSFEAIADRMQELVDYVNRKGYILNHEEQSAWIDHVYNEFKDRLDKVQRLKEEHDEEGYKRIREEYCAAWNARMVQHPKTWYDDKVAVVQILYTRGFQQCPFEGCKQIWNEDVYIVSRKTGRALTINRGTVHLAREHHLLERDNEYGITAREFYESFMS